MHRTTAVTSLLFLMLSCLLPFVLFHLRSHPQVWTVDSKGNDQKELTDKLTLKDRVARLLRTMTFINTSLICCRHCRCFQSLCSDNYMTRLYLSVALALTGRFSHSFTVQPNIHRASSSLRMSSTAGDSTKKVLVPIADGSEEIETTCITDTLVRFGADVSVASVMPGELVCKMSRGIKVSCSPHPRRTRDAINVY